MVRIGEWLEVLRIEKRQVSYRKFLAALLTGIVPRAVWRARMRRCAGCPIFDARHHRCRNGRSGCGCHCPTTALTAEPYIGGCWAYGLTGGVEGWPQYEFPNRWARYWSVAQFFVVDPLRKLLRTKP